MTLSALDNGLFDEVTMTREERIPRIPPAYDAAGDPVTDTQTVTLRAIVSPITGGQGRASPGSLRELTMRAAASGETPVVIECLTPKTAPAAWVQGTEFKARFQGTPGILRITTRADDNLKPIAEAFGTVLYGVFRPAGRAGAAGSGSGGSG